jgi:hypothetical protein
MPANNRLVILMGATANTFVLSMRALLALELNKFMLDLSVSFGGEVDVSNLIVSPRHKLYTRDLGDGSECVWMCPCIICERCISSE